MRLPFVILPLVLVPVGLVLLVVLSGAYWIPQGIYDSKVLVGVSLAGIDLSWTTADEAAARLTGLTSKANLKPIELQFNEEVWSINPNDFQLQVKPDKLAEAALRVGRRNGFGRRLKESWAALIGLKQPLEVEDNSLYDFNHSALTKWLASIAGDVNQPRRDAKLTIKEDRVVEFVAPQSGQLLDINKTVDLIAGSILSNTRKIDLPVETLPPKVTLAETNNLGIDTLLGQGESNFSGSLKNRRHNIGVGAGKFDGLLVAPNETFSFVQHLGVVDQSTGYLPELVIKGDETIPEFGGGLCQVSTTAFRAILHAGLPVVERRNHSYRVVYYEPAGSDATIYQPYPDLKFTNDTTGHILIDTYIVDNKLYFDFYGTDTDRRVELIGPRIYNVTDYPEPIYIDTSTLPVGETKRIDSAHRGGDAILTRKIFQGDKLVKTDVFKSHYIPWPAKYLRGAEDATKVETDPSNIAPTPPESDTPPVL